MWWIHLIKDPKAVALGGSEGGCRANFTPRLTDDGSRWPAIIFPGKGMFCGCLSKIIVALAVRMV